MNSMPNIVRITSDRSFDDAITQAKMKYGTSIKIVSQRNFVKTGMLGFGSKKTFEIDVLLNPPSAKPAVAQPLQPSPSDLIKAAAVVQAEKQDEVLKHIIEQLNSIQTQINHTQEPKQKATPKKSELFGELSRVKSILIEENDFSAELANELISGIKEDLSVAEAEDADYVEELLLKELRSRISFYRPTARTKPRVFILVGPTGVGKTTTLVKLAVINIHKDKKKSSDIRFINMDNYKTGAEKQLGAYASIMNRPFISLYGLGEELVKAVNDTKDADMLLVDTSGSSPYEISRLAHLSEAIDKFGTHKEVYLTISASTKESDICEILSMFKVLQYKAVILTKLDETKKIGSAISPLVMRREPVVYVTTGQNVGISDIDEASIAVIWQKLNGFSKNVIDKLLQQLEDENDFR